MTALPSLSIRLTRKFPSSYLRVVASSLTLATLDCHFAWGKGAEGWGKGLYFSLAAAVDLFVYWPPN